MKIRIKKTILALTLGLMAFWLAIPTANAQYQQAWVAHYDGPPITGIHSNDYVTDMVVRDSNVYVTGYEGLFGSDWATVKYDYAGQELWVSRYEEGVGEPEAMVVDAAGNVYVTGYNNNDDAIDLVTFKYNPDGVLLWERRYITSGGNNQPSDMAFDASGDIYISGASWIPEQGAFDLLLLKYDTDGNLLWDRTIDDGDGYTDSGYALAIDPDGNPIVAGFTNPDPYLVKYSPTGDLLWQDVHGGQSTNDYWRYVETDTEGNIYVFGQISPGGGTPNRLWTTKYDPDGNILWEQTYIGTYPNACYVGGLALMPDGGVVITGQSWDLPFYNNIVTIRYASDGTVLWQRNETSGYLHASGKDVAVDADGIIYVTGYGFGGSTEKDIITLGYSPDGDVLWTQIYIGSDYEEQSDYPHQIAVDETTNVFVAANSWGDNGNDFTTIRYSPTSHINLDIAVIMEGPFNGEDLFNGTVMNTDLNPAYIPLAQPYNIPPWNYSGTESVTSIPNPDIVDWILVELRDATEASLASGSTAIARQAAFLLEDGTITSLDGSSELSFNVTITDSLFVVIWHRNHLGIMSASPVTLTGEIYPYDFTGSAGQAYGGTLGHKEVTPGVWGMIAGDGDANGEVLPDDKTNVWILQAGQEGYQSGDFNLDGQIDIPDKNDYWLINQTKQSQIPE